MNNDQNSGKEIISTGRFVSGIVVFALGQMTTLLIPFVSASSLQTEMKAVISGLLFFVTPQIGIVLAIAILGKAGYDHIRKIILTKLKKYGPPQVVSSLRYRIGLVLFATPLIFGWIEPYIDHWIGGLEISRNAIAVTGDVIFISSFLVLGGEFWDKVRSLFVYRAKASFPEKNPKNNL
ncbi:hypothetical protein ACFL4E_02630 [Candidatus Omnitrophota bacterium]